MLHSHDELDGHSTRSGDDRLPMSSFLHTIPEGSSDIAASASPFNPEAAAAAAAEGPSYSNDSSWSAMMRPFRTSQPNPRPAAPASVSSTRADNAGVEDKSYFGSEAGNHASGMDGSLTAAVAGEQEQPDPQAGRAGVGGRPSAPIKRRRSSLARANKRKVGVVCFASLLVVIVVVIALAVIVRKLDDDQGADQANTSNASATNSQSFNGTDPSSMNTTGLQVPTLAPTIEESSYGFASAASATGTQNPAITAVDDDIVNDDMADDSFNEDCSPLVKLDEAIYMLYTAEEAQLNMLPHVSSEVFSNPLSPRYQAREWLLNNDTLLQEIIMESCSNQPDDTLNRIAQRYVMLVFYFSTLNDNDATTASASANNDGRKLRKLADQTAKFEIHPDVHECFWVPNACGQDSASDNTQVQSVLGDPSTATQLTSQFILYLNVSHANLKGTLPFELGYLSGLRELAIHGNELTGSIPELLLTQLQFLYVLDLSQNSFQGTIPPALWSLPTLRFAYLHGNKLTGSIPQTLPASPSSDLEEIWLRDNRLSGSIPQWWTDLPNLDVLSVRNNSWTGQLPEEWSQAGKLEFFDASYNQLTGNVPPSLLYGIPALQHLYLDYNLLVGALPTINEFDTSFAVGQSEFKMQALWLQYNQLTGTIPAGFGWEWSRLQELELHGNQFTGSWECIEDGINVWPLMEELAVDCWTDPTMGSEQKANLTQPTSRGIDMSVCKSCCIKCF